MHLVCVIWFVHLTALTDNLTAVTGAHTSEQALGKVSQS